MEHGRWSAASACPRLRWHQLDDHCRCAVQRYGSIYPLCAGNPRWNVMLPFHQKSFFFALKSTAQNFQKARFCAVFDVFLRFMKHFHVLCGFFERFSGAFPIPPPLSNRGQSFIITKWFGALLRMYDRREVRPAFLSGRSCCAAEHSQPIRAAAVVPCHVEKMGKGVFYYADK